MKLTLHNNRKRYASTFSKHWRKYSLTRDGYVLWSGDNPKEVPDTLWFELEAMPANASLGELIMMVARGIE